MVISYTNTGRCFSAAAAGVRRSERALIAHTRFWQKVGCLTLLRKLPCSSSKPFDPNPSGLGKSDLGLLFYFDKECIKHSTIKNIFENNKQRFRTVEMYFQY